MKHSRFLLFSLWLVFPYLAQAAEHLAFEEFYKSEGVYGLSFSQKVKDLAGKRVRVEGFMAPPLKAEAKFFVLTQKPMAICPFCSTDADWPADILVIYLENKQTFVQYNAMIRAEGILEYGSWTDPDTGFVSLLRLKEAMFEKK